MLRNNRSAFLSRLEHRRQPPLSSTAFVLRFARFIAGAGCLIAVALGGGMLGYHELEGLPWLDAFLNAAMILGGMGRSIRYKPTPENYLPEAMPCFRAWFSLSLPVWFSRP